MISLLANNIKQPIMNNKVMLWIAGIIIVIGVIFYFQSNSKENQSNTLKIGLIAPLSGDAAAYGEMGKNGASIAVEEINTAGGINGKQIEIIYEDGKCDAKAALNAAQKLINEDGVKYIVGGACSSETFAFVPLATASKVFVISFSASAPKLSGISKYFVRNYPNDNLVGIALAGHLSKKYKKVAVISEKTSYAQGVKDSFTAEAKNLGIEIVGAEDFDSTTVDFRTIILKIKSENPEIIFINPQSGSNTARIAKQIRQNGITIPLSGVNYTGPDVISGGSAVEGMEFAVPADVPKEGKGQEFLQKYNETYGRDPLYAYVAAAGYDDVYILKKAIESVGEDTNKVQDYIHNRLSFEGTLGKYSFDINGDLVGVGVIIQKIKNGKVELLK
ncbi:MAG: extracellular ligand-binding receptor, branched-chain amino acid transport system substrate-binding [Candidatus Nomurabacteria bacterium]|nr:extracellular ligand-binding receptor, branched-chain amino acid transport system substrate-binding [Candidatus Nomurabacteria bacterium]